MNNLENSFKEALQDFDQSSPSKGLWSRISTSLFLKSRAFKSTLWSLLALLIIAIPSVIISSQLQDINVRSMNKRTDLSLNNNYQIKNKKTSLLIIESEYIAKNKTN